MIALLLAVAAAEPVPASASLLLLPSSAGDAPVALRALPDGRAVLVVATRRGLARFEGRGDAWGQVAEVAGRAADEVAVDGAGRVWTRTGDALRRWDDAGLVPVPLPACPGCRPVHLRAEDEVVTGEAPSGSVPLADGLVADVVAATTPAGLARAPRVHRVGERWALDVGGQDVELAAAPGDTVVAAVTDDGWVALAGTRLAWSTGGARREGALEGVAPGPGTVTLRTDAAGHTVALAWDARVLRATTVDLADTSPIRWVEGWLPAGPSLDWPRPVAAGDPLQVVSQVEVTLPAGLAVSDVAVTPTHLVLAGSAATVDGRRPAVALVRR